MTTAPITAARLGEIAASAASEHLLDCYLAIPELLAEITRLQSDLDHATAHDGDHLSKASRRMVDTVMGDRDALRAKVRERDARIAALEAGLREACDNLDEVGCNWVTINRLRAIADAVGSRTT